MRENETEWQRKNSEQLARLAEIDNERKNAKEAYENSLVNIRSENEMSSKAQASKIQSLVDEKRALADDCRKEVSSLNKSIEELKSECSVKDQRIKALNMLVNFYSESIYVLFLLITLILFVLEVRMRN